MAEPSIAAQVVALTHLSVPQLREKWHQIFGEETKQRHRVYLIKRLSWELQRRESGQELSPEALKRLDELQQEFRDTPPSQWFRGAKHNRSPIKIAAPKAKARATATSPIGGSVLARDYKGERVVVTVRGEREYEWNGTVYRSLSAVAKAVTGSHCSGNAFFGLTKKGGAP